MRKKRTEGQDKGHKSNPATSKPTAVQPKLTHKQKLFVQRLIDNPTMSATKAVQGVYDVKTYGSARAVASENLTKPNIIMALDNASELFESVIVGTARDWGKSENTRQREIALDASKYGHDKVHGKARQSMDISTSSISLVLDLTGMAVDKETE